MDEIFFITKVFLGELLEKEAMRRVTEQGKEEEEFYVNGLHLWNSSKVRRHFYPTSSRYEVCRMNGSRKVSCETITTYFVFHISAQTCGAKYNGQSTKMSWDSFE